MKNRYILIVLIGLFAAAMWGLVHTITDSTVTLKAEPAVNTDTPVVPAAPGE